METENKLQVIIKESGLEATKAKVMLENFQDYFEIASDWEKKAKTIVVTNESQTGDMAMARTGRLYLREKRLAIENKRKELKEQSLREGRAIDGIANVLKALIVPIEDYLDRQEHFVKIKQKEEDERLLAEARAKIEADRLAQEKADREEQERIRLENIRLQKETEEKEKQLQKERLAAAKKQREIEIKADAERKVLEEKNRKDREKADKERLATEKKHREEREEFARQEHEKAEKLRLENEKKLNSQIECPFCHRKFIPEKELINNF